MKKMIKLSLVWVVLFAVFMPLTTFAHEQNSVTVKLNDGKNRTVHYFAFGLTEDLALMPVLADDRIGTHEDLASMAKRNNAVAAINGTFFNSYDLNDLMPQGTLMVKRELRHTGSGIMMGISSLNELTFTHDRGMYIHLFHQDQWQYWAWGYNRFNSSPQAIMVFDSYYKSETLAFPNTTFATVEKGVITRISQDEATIPANGFVVSLGTQAGITLKENDTLYYEIDIVPEQKSALHMLSNGPKLITNGKADIDYERDGINDPKMTQQAAQRSFIGKKADGTIVMGTVASVTIPQLAEVGIKLGMQEAINLDGGASSGLYYNGKYVTTPGRKLSNALVVVPKKRAPRIEVNGEQVFLNDAEAYVESGTTMIPVRGVLERVGAFVDWDQANQQVIAKYKDTNVIIPLNQTIALVNEEEKPISLPARSIQGRVYVPLRFLIEAFGIDLQWNQERFTVEIKAPDLLEQ